MSETALYNLLYCLNASLVLCETFFFVFLSLSHIKLLVFLLLSLPYVRLLAFYFWHHVMLLALKEDSTIVTFYLFYSLHVFGVIIKPGAV